MASCWMTSFFVVVIFLYFPKQFDWHFSSLKFDFCNFCCCCVNPSGSSSDLVPTLMDIFDSMIGNQHHHTMSPPSPTSDSSCVSSLTLQPTVAAAASDGHHHHHHNNLSSNQQPSPRHFPVLKIVEPGDPPLRQLTNVSPVATNGSNVSYSNQFVLLLFFPFIFELLCIRPWLIAADRLSSSYS